MSTPKRSRSASPSPKEHEHDDADACHEEGLDTDVSQPGAKRAKSCTNDTPPPAHTDKPDAVVIPGTPPGTRPTPPSLTVDIVQHLANTMDVQKLAGDLFTRWMVEQQARPVETQLLVLEKNHAILATHAAGASSDTIPSFPPVYSPRARSTSPSPSAATAAFPPTPTTPKARLEAAKDCLRRSFACVVTRLGKEELEGLAGAYADLIKSAGKEAEDKGEDEDEGTGEDLL